MGLQSRDEHWEKVPFVPRPSLVADPITAFGKRTSSTNEKSSILHPVNRAAIKPKLEILNRPIGPYISARDATRNRVQSEIKRYSDIRSAGGCQALVTSKDSMDMLLPKLHRTIAVKTPHRHVFFVEPSKYRY